MDDSIFKIEREGDYMDVCNGCIFYLETEDWIHRVATSDEVLNFFIFVFIIFIFYFYVLFFH